MWGMLKWNVYIGRGGDGEDHFSFSCRYQRGTKQKNGGEQFDFRHVLL
jgi:hypothetical protein